jgi:SAM-dependent methyltransferase
MTNTVQRRFAKAKEAARYYALVIAQLRGKTERLCNICGYKGTFKAFGFPPRPDALCPKCEALERHRLLKLWLDRQTSLVKGRDVLHFAPEPSVAVLFRSLARSYTSADIEKGKADLTLNIEAMDIGDGTYDCVVCSHVLEHVDDRLALAEIHRVLRPGGIAIIMVPLIEGWARTYENPSITTAVGRKLHFGQSDHVRFFGADVRGRISSVGFELDEFTAEEPDVSTFALLRGEKIFIARRPN